MNRGARHGAIFFSDRHCMRFLELVAQAAEQYGIRIHAYVLMSNHYHLLLESVRGNLSAAMRMISQEYTQFVNQSSGWDGPVFRGRFKNKVVMDDAHWHYLPVYMHLNPVKARLVTHASQYLWSSHEVYCGNVKSPDWLDTRDLMAGYGSPEGYVTLYRDVLEGRQMAPDEFEDVLFENRRTQKRKTAVAVKHRAFRTPTEAMREVAELTGVPVSQLKAVGRGRAGNAPRALAVWWLVFGAERSPGEAARKLGMTANAASKILSKFRLSDTGYQSDNLWRWKAELESRKEQ
jgi:REP element-mobilizing transposase RayT